MGASIIIGMSGGVDSAIAARLLLKQGFDVTGVFMKNWEEDDHNGQCTALSDLADAQQVCDTLGIALKTVNFSAEYWDDVFENFLEEYQAGRTPNPDILCNKHIKFKAFLDYSIDLGAEYIATGHYARIVKSNGYYQLLKGSDANKDQSYFLYTLGQKQLKYCLFPLGEINKTEVRAIAKQTGFKNYNKKDSTGICFIGERKFREFLQRFLPIQAGEIQTDSGHAVGQHQGLMYYTLGQRRGLGIGGIKGADEDPWYVLSKNIEDNVLVIGQGHNHPLMLSHCLEASQLNWVKGIPLTKSIRCTAKTRYRQTDQNCVIEPQTENRCGVIFDQPQRAMTPGQSVVFYEGDQCIGGGIIDSVGS